MLVLMSDNLEMKMDVVSTVELLTKTLNEAISNVRIVLFPNDFKLVDVSVDGIESLTKTWNKIIANLSKIDKKQLQN
ncbi:MAG: hypothetical protein PHH26_00465 [Candidatus Thermoplasmatota archaeon]|nr:hypothetical protein [Candidatus Thermoplasmatota archaeon]